MDLTRQSKRTRVSFPTRAAAWAALLAVAWLVPGTYRLVQAQVSVTGRSKNFVAPVTDAQGRKTVLRGQDVNPVGTGQLAITKMQAETYRGQEKDMIVEAPKCLYNTKANVATSPGALSIHTADGGFSLQGESFRWELGDSRLTSKLVLSNQVHALVRKRFLGSKSSAVPAGLNPNATPQSVVPPPSSSGATNEFIDIVSDRLDYQGDVAVFRGKVRAHESEGDLTCSVLKVVLQGENGAVEHIEAEENVALAQGATQVTADKASYTVAQDKDLVEFLGHAVWNDGQRQGSGEHVIFNRREHTVRSEQKAYLKMPRGMLAETASFPKATPSAGPLAGATNAFVEVFANVMTIQLPATNGPVQRIVAEQNVLIEDSEQQTRALSDLATYDEITGILELTGSPTLETQQRLITGKVLQLNRGTQVLTAAPEAFLRLPLHSLGRVGVLSKAASNLPANAVPSTNQFLEVWAQEFTYQTNLLRFREHVRANFLESDEARGKLTCDLLTIHYGQQLESMLAERKVELEQFALTTDLHHTGRRVDCDRLKASFTPEGRLKLLVAEQDVNAEQEENRADRPDPLRSTLRSEKATAIFSEVTNRVEKIVAETNVVFTEDKRIARGAQAVYQEATGLLELTGAPTAVMPEGRITQAQALIWDRVHQRFIGKGPFKSEWKRSPKQTNQLSAPTAQAH
jgi:lipopolysaccharide export system protein LptA